MMRLKTEDKNRGDFALKHPRAAGGEGLVPGAPPKQPACKSRNTSRFAKRKPVNEFALIQHLLDLECFSCASGDETPAFILASN